MYGLIFAVILIVALAVSGYRMNISQRERVKASIRDSYGKASGKKITENRRKALLRNMELLKGSRQAGDMIDDLTWSDAGMDDIFRQMDTCRSSAGEEFLFSGLHDISSSEDDIRKIDGTVRELSEDESLRLSLGTAFAGLGYVRDRSLPEYLEHMLGAGKFINPFFHILADLFYIVIIFIMFLRPVTGLVFLVVLILVQISSYFSLRKTAEDRLCGMSMITRLSQMGKDLPSDAKGETGELVSSLASDLKSLRKKNILSSFVMNSGPDSSGGLFSMIFTYINLLFHFDLIACAFLLSGVSRDRDKIMSAYKAVGYLDMCLAVSSYRAYLEKKGGWCSPEFTDGAYIDIRSGFNPLIDEPVANDAYNDGGVLITGSNASGKSTYMRMIAVNAILAQTVATCAAVSYKASMFRIYSSIAVNDNILKGESYFMAEIKSLKRIVDAGSQEGRPVICFIDEILRGTNTSERISASCAVLKYLSQLKVIVFAATHDLELTSMVSGMYENVHFTEDITDDDVTFTYRLEKGPTNSRNAIALLRKNGFPESIISESEEICSGLTVKV
ncbi:MAG: hypothetical protein ILP17_08710 [Lachnospiraceae bacterium]|nr:hypothetical protein [Lachnospiraceae bacterium]